jgi:glycerol-3-phosphate dehydrogenase (NAD(P)+)
MNNLTKASVIGGGAWGTALSIILSANMEIVEIYDRRPEVVAAINQGCNTFYLPEVVLPKNIRGNDNLQQCCHNSSIVVIAVPMNGLPATASILGQSLEGKVHNVVIATKGIDPTTLKLPLDIAKESGITAALTILSGPNFAKEIAMGKPAITGLASHSPIPELMAAFSGKNFKVFYEEDVISVQICGALKNVMAIAAGICHGLELGSNAKAALISLAIEEIKNFAQAWKASNSSDSPITLGIPSIGDIILTCTSTQSRNATLGNRLARGESLEAILDLGLTVEGYATAKPAYDIAQKIGVKCPIIEATYKILYEGADIRKTIQDIF